MDHIAIAVRAFLDKVTDQAVTPAEVLKLEQQLSEFRARLERTQRRVAIQAAKAHLIAAGYADLAEQLDRLAPTGQVMDGKRHVQPKYRDTANPSNTWSGRGRAPKWLQAYLDTGHDRDEFAI